MQKIAKKLLTINNYYDIITSAVENGRYGSIAQLGEHLPYKQRVIGSSPIVSTIFYNCGRESRSAGYKCRELHLIQMRPGSSVG